MAAGDFTVDATSRQVIGTVNRISVTCEVDDTLRAFDILPDCNAIVKCTIDGNSDGGDIVKSIVNEDASGTADYGSVALQSGTNSTDTFRVTLDYI